MYKFIKVIHDGCRITKKDIQEIEKNFNIKLPSAMVDFYCHYNGAEVYLSVYTNETDEFEADVIYPIKYTFLSEIRRWKN